MSDFFRKIGGFFMAIIMFFMNLFGIGVKPEDKGLRNVIFLIGDGMGVMSVEKVRAETGAALALDSFPVRSLSQTASANSSVTDSAPKTPHSAIF